MNPQIYEKKYHESTTQSNFRSAPLQDLLSAPLRKYKTPPTHAFNLLNDGGANFTTQPVLCCRLNCQDISQTKVQMFYEEFWKSTKHDQHAFLVRHTTTAIPARRRPRSSTPKTLRKESVKYYIFDIMCCQKFFLAALDISEKKYRLMFTE